MKKEPFEPGDLLPEDDFNYTKAKPNRFAASQRARTVVVDEDVAQIFMTAESVNKALRALLEVLPMPEKRRLA